MPELPLYIQENLHKVLIGLVTILVVLVPLTLFTARHLPKKGPIPPKPNSVQTAVIAKQSYKNPTYNYSFDLPTGWKAVDTTPNDLYNDELFYPANDASQSGKTIGVRVINSVGPEWDSIQAYFQELLDTPMGENVFSYGRIVKLANVTVNGTPAAMQIEESTSPDGTPYVSKNVYVYKNGKLYVLMNSGDTMNEIDARNDTFNKIVGSFKFL